MKNIKPLRDKIFIEEIPWEKVSSGGIVFPETAKDGQYTIRARVVAVGDGKVLKNGDVVPPSVAVGDLVVLGKHHGSEVTSEGKTYRIVPEDVIEGVIEED